MRLVSTRNDRGDSIVEVLIAAAIVSLVLVSGFAITRKSTQAIQNNQERIQARHLAESQLEALRANDGITAPNECFSGSVASSGATCDTFTRQGSGATYKAHTVLTAPNTYRVAVSWTSIGASRNDNNTLSLVYRLK